MEMAEEGKQSEKEEIIEAAQNSSQSHDEAGHDSHEEIDHFDVAGDQQHKATSSTGKWKIMPEIRATNFTTRVAHASHTDVAAEKRQYSRKGSSHSSSHSTSQSSFNGRKTDLISAMVVKETLRRQSHKEYFMLHPLSHFVNYWTLSAAILLVYISITVPLFLAFEPALPHHYVAMDMLIDIFFIFDIVINFRTGYFPNYNRPDLVIMNPKEVAKAYMKSWFIVDLFSGIPFVSIGVLLFDSNGTGNDSGLPEHELKLLKLARILRLAKLTKLAKVSTIARRMDEAYVDLMVTNPGVVIALRMLKLIVVGVCIVHYMSCGWFMVGKIHDSGWVKSTGSNKLEISEQYLISVYWVVTTMTTVGYGDISADNGPERGFSIFAMITGCGFYGLLIAQITSIVAEAESNRRIIAERIDAIASYVHAKDFSPQLQKQILVYYRNFLKKNSVIDEWQVLKDLSSGLRGQVIKHLMTNVISNNPFFVHLQHHTAELFHIMHLQVVERGQHLSRKGQISRDMLVLLVGSAVILDESEASVKAGHGEPIYPLYEVTPGAIFGERCALGLDESYNTTVRALSNCELYVIFSDELLAALGRRLFNGLRRKCTTDSLFKVRLRSYCIANISTDHLEMLKKMMFELPSDPIRRTWSRRTKANADHSGLEAYDIDEEEDDEEEEDGDENGNKKKRSEKFKSKKNENTPFGTDAFVAAAQGQRRDSDIQAETIPLLSKRSSSMVVSDSDRKLLSDQVSILNNKVSELSAVIENMQLLIKENQAAQLRQEETSRKQLELLVQLVKEKEEVSTSSTSPLHMGSTLPPIKTPTSPSKQDL